MEQGCGRCGRFKPIKGLEHCKQCLCKIIERKVRKKLGLLEDIIGWQGGAKKRLAMAASGDRLNDRAAAYFVHRFMPAAVLGKSAGKRFLVGTATSDDAAAALIEEFISGKGVKSAGKKAVELFHSITEMELEAYASIKKIKYGRAAKPLLRQKLAEFQAKHPGTIEAIARSKEKLVELLEK